MRVRGRRIRGWHSLALILLLSSARASQLHERESVSTIDPVTTSRGVYAFTPTAFPATSWAEKHFEAIRLESPSSQLADPSPQAIYVFFQTPDPLPDHELQLLLEGDRLLIDFKKPGVVFEVPPDEVLAALMSDEELARAVSALGLGSGKLQNLEGIVPEVATLMANVFLLMQARALELAMLLRRLFRLDKKEKTRGEPFGAGDGPGIEVPGIEPYLEVDLDKAGKTHAGARRMIRSVFKILVGCCLGLLIWGFVRNL